MDWTLEEIQTIVEEGLAETTKDLELFLKVLQVISQTVGHKDGARALRDGTPRNPLLIMFNEIYTQKLILERMDKKLDRLLAKAPTERVEHDKS